MTTATVFAVVITAATIYVAAAVVAAAFTATAAISVSSASTSDRSLHSVNSVRPWSYYPLAPFPQSVTSIWMETDRVGDAGGKGGNLKKNRLSQDPRRLNSDK
jgi:H+/Cl- antiporter ClcA